MSKKVADGILRGLEQALAYVRGEADISKYRVHTPQSIKAARDAQETHGEKAAQQFGFGMNAHPP